MQRTAHAEGAHLDGAGRLQEIHRGEGLGDRTSQGQGPVVAQDHQASLLIIGAFVMTVWVLAKYGFNLSALIGGAIENGGQAVADPGAQYGLTGTTKLD